MREVQILANMPVHPNICRYYHTWMEPDWSAVEPEGAHRAASPPNQGVGSATVSDGGAAHVGRGGEQGPTPTSSSLAANTHSSTALLTNNLTSSGVLPSSSNPNPTPSVRFAAFPCEPGKAADPLDALNDGWDLAVPTSLSSPASSSSGTVGGPGLGGGGGRVVVAGPETSEFDTDTAVSTTTTTTTTGGSESHCCCCLGCVRHDCVPIPAAVYSAGHERRSSSGTVWSKKAAQTEINRRASSWDKHAQGQRKATPARLTVQPVKKANLHNPKVAVVTDSRIDASFGDDGDDDEDKDDDEDEDEEEDEEEEEETEPFPIEDDGGFDFSEWPTGNVEDQQQQLGMDSTLSSIPSPTSSTASSRSRASSLLDARSPALAAVATTTTASFPFPPPADKLEASSRSRSLFPTATSRPLVAATRAPVASSFLTVPSSTHHTSGSTSFKFCLLNTALHSTSNSRIPRAYHAHTLRLP